MKSKNKTKEPQLSNNEKLKAALVPEDEQPYPIPEHWVWTKIASIADINMGQSPAGVHTNTDSNGLPLVGGPADMGDVYPTTERFTSKPTKICEQGDIIISVRATIGKLNIADKEYCLGRGVAGIRGIKGNQHFIKRFLETCTRSLMERGTGTTFLQISKNDIATLAFPLPPLPEQQRIAKKLESLLGKIKEAKALLDEIPEILQNFRQTVLAVACSGKLTKDWRKVNPNVALSEPIAASPAQNDLPGLPATWNITSIDQIGTVKGGKRLPKGDMLVEYDTGYPYIKAGNLKNGTVITDQMEFLTPQSQKRIKNYTVSGGDVYITIVGAYIGDAGVIPDELDGANLTENAAKICNLVNCNNRYLAFWLRSEKSQTIIRDRISSATQGKLALFRIKSLPVPLPPLPEQQEIVRRVESLFSKADDLEAQYKEAMELIETLPEIILTKAFRGELVPQDPNDEPASRLLERVLIEKESTEKETIGRRKVV